MSVLTTLCLKKRKYISSTNYSQWTSIYATSDYVAVSTVNRQN